jgi:hypothetical protein
MRRPSSLLSAINHVLLGQSNIGDWEIGREEWPMTRVANDCKPEGSLR